MPFYGGSERGLLPCVDLVSTGDILLEIDGISVLGYTTNEIEHVLSKQTEHTVKLIEGGNNFPVIMRDFLSRRFQPDCSDQILQNIVRNSVYRNTVPFTTRSPRQNEQPGLDYNFINNEQYLEMEKDDQFIESGVHCGFFYATSKPQSDDSNK